MREYNSIISDIEQYFDTRLDENKNKEDYDARKTHFVRLQDLMQEGKFSEVLAHIQAGKKAFWGYLVKSQRYYDLLAELERHFETENNEDKQKRQRKLVFAILSNNVDKVSEALNKGGYAVFHEIYHDNDHAYISNQIPIMIALNQKQYNSLYTLLRNMSEAEFIKFMRTSEFINHVSLNNLNPLLNPNKKLTLLHFVVIKDLTDILNVMLNCNIDLNERDINNHTALDYACEMNNESTAIIMLRHGAKASSNLALLSAIENNKPRLANELIKSGAKIDKEILHAVYKKHKKDPENTDLLYQLFKLPYKQKKHSIIALGSVSPQFFSSPVTAQEFESDAFILSAICSQIYYENSELNNLLHEKIKCFIQEDKLNGCVLRPLLNIIALSCRGIRANDNGRLFKAIINTEANVMNLVMSADKYTFGMYRSKKTVFVAGKKFTRIMSTLLHEMKHFVDKKVFKSVLKNFSVEFKKQFELIKKNLENEIRRMPTDLEEFRLLKLSFGSAALSDDAEQLKNVEILARIPETLGLLGPKNGAAFLSLYTPDLWKFYQEVYNPALEKYIQMKIKQLPSNNTNLTKNNDVVDFAGPSYSQHS